MLTGKRAVEKEYIDAWRVLFMYNKEAAKVASTGRMVSFPYMGFLTLARNPRKRSARLPYGTPIYRFDNTPDTSMIKPTTQFGYMIDHTEVTEETPVVYKNTGLKEIKLLNQMGIQWRYVRSNRFDYRRKNKKRTYRKDEFIKK